ncbi:MAG: glycoside hydrolase family 3 C-terminal domain-containing protein [Oscillospiraceae bacterium]|nr:glycoside hydrolase family 3 C-terminal domain-containing protein [Oscillospiraceae bacterium]
MQQFLTNTLGPIFYGMGVSEADFTSYLGMCMGYVYGILAAIVVLIIVLIAAHWVKKGSKALTRGIAVIAFILVVAILANAVCLGPLRSNISTVLSGSNVSLSDETVAASKDVIKKVGEEGFVLVKNNGILPLAAGNLNVFGWGSTNPILGGTGSGSSDGSSAVGILQSLSEAGFTTNADLTKLYTDYATERPTVAMQNQDWTLPEPTVDAYTDAVMTQAKGFSDTAVIVISRSGGEGADLPTDMNAVIHGTYNIASQVSVTGQYGYYNGVYTNNGNYDDFEPGEHYLELSVTEENMVEKVCSEFDNVVVIINANNAMELGWVDEYPQIGAVILAPGAGNTGLLGLGEIMSGAVNPSGKTVDTYVKDLTATPTWNNFGNFAYSNVDDLKNKIAAADPAYEGNMAFVNYVEGIYVGYKFYETAAEEGLITYEDEVQYPFGYGLSYTTFDKTIANFNFDGTNVTFDVNVTNTGSVAGKDVAEIYFTPPYTNGGIEKASVNLIDFQKTDVLEPGASQTLSFSIPAEDMASYDSEGIKIAGGGYILEAGDYKISVRSDSHTVAAEETFNVASDVDYSGGRSSDLVPANNQFEDYSRGDFEQLSRADGFANYETATAAPANFEMSAEVRAAVEPKTFGTYDPTAYDDASDVMPTLGAQNGLTLYNLSGKAYDDPQWDTLLDQLTFEDMSTMVNLGGWQTAAIPSVGKPATSDCDGPAGLSNFITGAYGTAYPAEVLMAQTWNTVLIEEMGVAMGQEYQDANNYGWYGPAMNTHRNAFAGRNFEYYSEDGVLAGKMAVAEINGGATKGVYPYIKHFALNDQEGNRCSFLLTWASEQTIREIYLKPFEMAVKGYTGTPLAVMSSFNWIGTEPSCANPHLLNTVLRDEWGFVGMVETDYNGSYGYQITDECVRNGNDLMLGFAMAASNQLTDQSATATLALRESCKNILYTVANSGYYTNVEGDPTNQPDPLVSLLRTVDIVLGAVLLVLLVLMIVVHAKNKKKRAA